jgi:toxin-antitoxin system PIN domain toxin
VSLRVVKRGLDTNILIYAHLPGFQQHEQVRRYLLNQLRLSEVKLVVTPLVLHEFVHVVTDARRFEAPVPISEAVAVAHLFLRRTNVECLAVDEAALLSAFTLLDRHRLGRKRIADTLFAATLLHHGVTEIVTCNPGDFRLFDGLRVIDPCDLKPAPVGSNPDR